MKAGWSIPIFMLFLFGCGKTQETRKAELLDAQEVPPHVESPLKREMDFAYGAIPSNNPLAAENLPEFDTNAIMYVHHSFADQLFAMINPESLQKYEGSYTVGEFKADQKNAVPEYNLSSAWVFHNKQYPRAGIKVARNPATGRYEVSGGEIFIKEPGVGVSYEKDEASGEEKAFFNVKREF